MSDLEQRLAANLARVRERIAAAAESAGRPADSVTLVAATKSLPVELVRKLSATGCRHLGESRPQELWSKAPQLADLAVDWHFIGHLQRNKLRRTLPLVSLFHSIDSLRLLDALEHEAQAAGRRVRALVEVNVSGEQAKHGFAPSELEPLLPELAKYAHVEVCGLMAMAGLAGGPAAAETDFARLRTQRDRLVGRLPAGVSLSELSMGMSEDFEAAIRQGATLVRIGSALVEGCDV